MDAVWLAATTAIAASTGPAHGTNQPQHRPESDRRCIPARPDATQAGERTLEYPSHRRHEQAHPHDHEGDDPEGAQQPGRQVQLGNQPHGQQCDRRERADQARHHQVRAAASRDGVRGAVTRKGRRGQHSRQHRQHAWRQPGHEAGDESDSDE